MPFSIGQVLKAVALALLGLLVISSAVLFWALSTGPIQLSTLTPSIQRAVASLPGDYAIQLKGCELVWDRQVNVLQLRATQVALLDHRRVSIATAPTVNISISVAALMSRVIALSTVELKGVSIHLVRNKDGSSQLGAKTGTATTGIAKTANTGNSVAEFHDLTQVLAHLLAALESSPDPQQPLSYLKVINVKGDFTLEDRKLDMDVQFSEIDFLFRGKDNGIAGDLELSIDSPDALSGIDLEVSLQAHGKDVTANIKVGGVQPARLAGLDERLKVLAGVDLTLNGTIAGAMTLPDTIKPLQLDFTGGTGSVSLDQVFPNPLLVRAFALKAVADPSAMSLDLSSLSLSLGKDGASGPDLEASGKARSVNGSTSLELAVVVENFEIKDLASYWPPGVVPGTRAWLVENLQLGMVDKANLDINLTLPPPGGGPMALEKLQGKLAYSDLSVSFYRPLPAATGITGSGTFSQQGFDLTVDHGQVEKVAIKSGRVQIKGLDVGKVALEVTTTLAGGVADALAVLELPPIALDEVIGFSAQDVGGQLTAELGIALPLKAGLTPAEIDYHVDARLKQASVTNLFSQYNLENGALEIYDDPGRLGIKGSLDLAGVPVTLDLEGIRDQKGALTTKIKARAAAVKAADITRLAYPAEQYLAGHFAIDLNATTAADGLIEIAIDTDLSESGLSIPALHWHKPAGEKGSASATVRISKGKPLTVNDLSVAAGTLAARGEATYDSVGSRLTIDLESAALGRTLLSDLRVSHDPKQGTRISVAGGRLDLEPLLGAGGSQADSEDDNRAAAAAVAAPDKKDSGSALGTVQIDVAKLKQVFFTRDRFLESVSLGLTYDDSAWQSIRLNGRNPYSMEQQAPDVSGDRARRLQQGDFKFSFGPLTGAEYPLSIEVENLGSLLVTTLDNHFLAGGYLTVKGESSSALLTAPVRASVKLDRFTVMDAPVFAEVLNIASLNHPLATMKSAGLVFDSFAGELLLSGQKVLTERVQLHGGTLGMTVVGNIDFDQEVLDVRGGIIPLYRISNVLEKIPLLKHTLVGDDGRGVLALDYTVKGSMGKPAIAVIPGVLLTPGALRHFFDSSATEQQAD